MSEFISNFSYNLGFFFSHLQMLGVLQDDKPDFSGLATTVVTWLNAFLIPVFVIIGGFSIYKLISLGWKIAHSADQPEERRLAIQGIIWWGLGLVISIASPVLVNVLVPSLIKAAGGGYKPPSS